MILGFDDLDLNRGQGRGHARSVCPFGFGSIGLDRMMLLAESGYGPSADSAAPEPWSISQ
jgi:hypothetical protein